MFDIFKIQKKKIVSNAVNLMPRYRSDISYNWTTTFDGSGNRQLINAGESNPNYKATMHSGRGLKFGVNISYKIDVTQGQTLYKFDITNNNLVIENITFTGVYELGKVGGTGAYEDIIYNNVMVSNDTFTDSELGYLHNHPEKFLYHEKQLDGTFVAKSNILSQDKIDSVVAHFPMCETDGYVRNMIGYSETPFNTNTGLNGFSGTEDYHGVVANLTIESGSIRATDNADNTNTPRIVLSNKTKPNTSYRLKYSLTIDESVHNLTYFQVTHSADWNNNGGIAVVNGGLNQTTGELVFTTTDDTDKQYCGITVGYDGANDSNGAFWDLHYFELQELTETYPIENFTNAARDDAKNLTTSLQTCLLETDGLGIMIGSSFDELACDGSGYVDTGWTPDLTKYLATEYVVINTEDNMQFFGCVDNATARYALGFLKGTMRILLGDKYPTFSTTDITHIVLVTTGVIGESKVFINGEDRGLIGETTLDIPKSTFYLGAQGLHPYNSNIILFNIHTTPQDPAKLYADAVKKGLMPE